MDRNTYIGIECRDNAELSSMVAQSMYWALLFRESLNFVREGIATDLSGLRCPLHCNPASYSLILLTFLLGLLSGGILVLGFGGLLRFPSAPEPSAPNPRGRGAAGRLALSGQQ